MPASDNGALDVTTTHTATRQLFSGAELFEKMNQNQQVVGIELQLFARWVDKVGVSQPYTVE